MDRGDSDVGSKPARQVAVGICAYNEEENIGDLLEAVISQCSRPGLNIEEIVTVASGCTDNTVSIIREHASRDPRVKVIVENEREGKAKALNQILSNYRTEFLVLIPADAIPDPAAIQLLVEVLADKPEVGVVSGHPIPADGGNGMTAYAVGMIWRMHHRALGFFDREGKGAHATGELMALRRGCVELVPDDIVNDDAYIGIETWKSGYKVKYCPEALVYIAGPRSIVELIRQRRRIITGHLQLKQRTGRFPSTLEALALRDFRRVFPILRQEFRDHRNDTWRFFVVTMVEALTAVLAVFDLLRGSVPVKWRKILTCRGSER